MNALTWMHRALLVLALLTPAPLWAAAGKVVIAAGDVFAINAQDQRRLLQRRDDVFEGDTLTTGANGQLQLRFEDNAILALRANSRLRISEYHGANGAQGERVLMDLLAGGFRTISGNFGKTDRDAYQVRTPTASIGIRGTHYEAVFESETLTVGVYEGGISVTNAQGTLNLGLDSDFLYAEVQSGVVPQGLLNPPANLNVPNTPQANPNAGTSDTDDEASDDDSSDDSGDSPEDALPNLDDEQSPAPANTPDGTNLPIPDADAISDGDFNFSAIEDGIDDQLDKQDPDSVVALSSAEINALKSSVQTIGVLVFAPGESPSSQGPIVAYSAQVGGNQIGNVYVAYDSQTGRELDDNFYLPNLVMRPDDASNNTGVDANGGAIDANWEYWNAGNEPIDVEAGSTSEFDSTTLNKPFFYILAEPTQAKLSGTSTFELCSGCYAVSGMDNIESASGGMKVNFNNANAVGYLAFVASPGSGSSDWNLAFSGQVNGAVLQASLQDNLAIDLGSGSITYDSEHGGSDLTGNVTGIFTGGSNNMEFAGGFSVNDDSTNNAHGVFVMEDTSN